MTEDDVRAIILKAREEEGVRGLAKRLGFCPAFISDLCNLKRPLTKNVLKALGIRKIVMYELVPPSG